MARMMLGTQVCTTQEFVEYLRAKDPARVRVTFLPFKGRNKVIFAAFESGSED